MKFVIPNSDGKGYGFRKGEKYKVIEELPNNGYVVSNPLHEKIIVRVGKPSMRLDLTDSGEYGEFHLVDIPFEDEAVNYPLTAAANALADKAASLANQIRVGKAHIGGAIITSGALTNESVAIPLNGKMYTSETIKKIERDRDNFKEDCIKAEAVIDQLYDIFPDVRNREQLIAAVKRSKIFGDAFIEMQKMK